MRGFLALPAGAWQSHLSQSARHPHAIRSVKLQ
ncbi:hypothetical protein Vch1786_I0291 [Vibrio cholerae O1 str. 2010EL-1786]|uniref:Uncharacterized protein n=2 Tax=Vibrio cholerae TaxID=666 RepID=Q9KTV2_VIBCH|nr:hypothetical protein VC_0785 [Vibrio cholerae O1 biovar El Tor str. N16961]ACP05064.1 conserved hypothetical protein [Vibrio cholerae M66-2]ACP08819.1 conserved hypothetical protein [Vibrio cholerae O395]ACQ61697.1 hypothetical protein VCD_003541 [Vibrio cholerae MJ-1236]AET25901.1 hypothetical protein Vch1786_I0291 [Vibrio cholerae O1 str. 2010EL-1786]EEO09538.1 hypothetical protein VCC_001873 [Vibrio cholerae RC9]EEO15634.1 hypothetical protein VCE_002135 [Vibrio cholerae B33]EEO22740.1